MYLQSIVNANGITITDTSLTPVELALIKITGSKLYLNDLTVERIQIVDPNLNQILSIVQI